MRELDIFRTPNDRITKPKTAGAMLATTGEFDAPIIYPKQIAIAPRSMYNHPNEAIWECGLDIVGSSVLRVSLITVLGNSGGGRPSLGFVDTATTECPHPFVHCKDGTIRAGWPGLLILRALPTQCIPDSFAFLALASVMCPRFPEVSDSPQQNR
jgi:hypothetical protein